MRILEKILNLIFPPVCGFCGEIDENYLCDKCGRRLEQIKISRIDDYINQPVYFDEHFYLFKYEKEIRELFLKYKFNENSYLYKSFAKVIAQDMVFREQFINKYDYIICVPIHKKRYRTRGYNQSKLIAKEVAGSCGKAFYDDVLVKSKNIVAQSSLDKLDRVRNIKNAFSVGNNSDIINNKKIAIFDDIFTTGSTTNECASVLKQAGADFVGVFTFAKG